MPITFLNNRLYKLRAWEVDNDVDVELTTSLLLPLRDSHLRAGLGT
jgi:hypothetical protein